MELEFHASIATGKNAITVDGNGDGAEIKFCIPRSDMRAVLGLQLMTEQLLKIKVTIDDKEKNQSKESGAKTESVVDFT